MNLPPYPPNIDDINVIIKLIGSNVSHQCLDINAKYDDFEETLLHYAARRGHTDIVKYLISKGADINATDRYHNVPLQVAARSGNIGIAKLLLDAGVYRCTIKRAIAYCIYEYEYEPVPTKGVHMEILE